MRQGIPETFQLLVAGVRTAVAAFRNRYAHEHAKERISISDKIGHSNCVILRELCEVSIFR